MTIRSISARLLMLWLALAAAPRTAQADVITVLSSNGLRAVLEDLVPAFEHATRHQVVLHFSVAAELKKRIDGGEAFDLAILTPPLIEQLIAEGKVVRETRTPIARAGMAI